MKKPSAFSERAIFLSPEAPYPLGGGGSMRSASLLTFLANHMKIHLITFASDCSQNSPPSPGRDLITEVTRISLPQHSTKIVSRMYRNIGRVLRGQLPLTDRFGGVQALWQVRKATQNQLYRLAVVEHFWCAPYLEVLRSCAQTIVLDLHNIESVLHASCSSSEPWPQKLGHLFFERTARKMEEKLLSKFDLVLVASEADRRRVLEIAPTTNVIVYPNSIPWVAQPHVEEEDVIAFSGNMEYHPNITAVNHFRRQVWTMIRSRTQSLRWRLIGKNESIVRSLVSDDPSIEVTGPPDDSVIELAKAKVVVVPLLAGSGTRVKILEAWAAGRAVVSTTIGADGLTVYDGENIRIADSPRDIAETVLELLNDNLLRKQIGEKGRKTYESEFCWPAAWRTFEPHFVNLMSQAKH